METVTLTEAHHQLQRLTGAWEGEETCHPSPWNPEKNQALGRATCRLALGGFAVIGDYEQHKGGELSFTGHGVYTYDPATDEYVCHWFDSMGLAPSEFRGKLENGVMTLTCHDEQFGHCRLTYDLTAVEEKRYGFAMDMSQDGVQWQPAMEGSYRRTD